MSSQTYILKTDKGQSFGSDEGKPLYKIVKEGASMTTLQRVGYVSFKAFNKVLQPNITDAPIKRKTDSLMKF